MRIKVSAASIAIAAALSGCGGGGGGESNPSSAISPQTGVFTDSEVANVKYKTATQEGFTNEKGEFTFLPGEKVTFSIGKISLGEAVATSVVTPIDLPAPIKVARFLQSLDSDGEGSVDTPIVISPKTHRALEDVLGLVNQNGNDIDLDDIDDAQFDAKLADVITDVQAEADDIEPAIKDTLVVVTKTRAKQHLNNNPHIQRKGGLKKGLLSRIEKFEEQQLSNEVLIELLEDTGMFDGDEFNNFDFQEYFNFKNAIVFDQDGAIDEDKTIENLLAKDHAVTILESFYENSEGIDLNSLNDALNLFTKYPVQIQQFLPSLEEQRTFFSNLENGQASAAEAKTVVRRFNALSILSHLENNPRQVEDQELNHLFNQSLLGLGFDVPIDFTEAKVFKQNGDLDIDESHKRALKLVELYVELHWNKERTQEELNLIFDKFDLLANTVTPISMRNSDFYQVLVSRVIESGISSTKKVIQETDRLAKSKSGIGPVMSRAEIKKSIQQLYSIDIFDIDYSGDIVLDENDNMDWGATLTKVATRNSRVAATFKFLESNPTYVPMGLRMLGFTNIEDNDYQWSKVLKDTSFKFDEVQSLIDGTNKITKYARSQSEGPWPDRDDFPTNGAKDFDLTNNELKEAINNAHFADLSGLPNNASLKKMLVLTNKNTVNRSALQKNIEITRPHPGVRSIDNQVNNGSNQSVILNDGSILTWEKENFEVFNISQSPATQLFTNTHMTAAIRADGSVVYWKNNGLTDFTVLDVDARTIVSTHEAMAVVLNNGSITTFSNYIGYNGRIPQELDFSAYQQDLEQHKVVSVVASDSAFAAILENGQIISWGKNVSESDQQKLQVIVPGADPQRPDDSPRSMAKAIYANSQSFSAILYNGGVVSWGNPSAGGSTELVEQELVGELIYNNEESKPGVISIASTKTAFAALREDGKVVVWGEGSKGGLFSIPDSLLVWPDHFFVDNERSKGLKEFFLDEEGKPKKELLQQFEFSGVNFPSVEEIAELDSGVKAIYASDSSFTAIKDNGKSVMWGGEDTNKLSEENKVALNTEIEKIVSSEDVFIAIFSDGSATQWGAPFGTVDSWGDQYGTGPQLEKINGSNPIKDAKISSNTVAVLYEDGSVYQWGIRGLNLVRFYKWNEEPNHVEYPVEWFTPTTESQKFVSLENSDNGFVGLRADGSIVSWGGIFNANSFIAKRHTGPNESGNNFSGIHDLDGDGIMSDIEIQDGSSPFLSDTDGDGVLDHHEKVLGTSPTTHRLTKLLNGAPFPDDKLRMLDGETVPASWYRY